MRKGMYRYVRKSSLGAFNFGGTCGNYRSKQNAGKYIIKDNNLINNIPTTWDRKIAVALIEEIESMHIPIIEEEKNSMSSSSFSSKEERIKQLVNAGSHDYHLISYINVDNFKELLCNLYEKEEGYNGQAKIKVEKIIKESKLDNKENAQEFVNRINKRVVDYTKAEESMYILFFCIFMIIVILVVVAII